jgi:Polysaccharide lyase
MAALFGSMAAGDALAKPGAPAKPSRTKGDLTPPETTITPGPTDPAPTPTDPPTTGCQLKLATLTAPGCTQVYGDSATLSDVTSLWGDLGCATSSRHVLVSDGDPHPTAAGVSQGDSSSRRLTVIDGDDVWGERCEIGKNSWKTGPTAVYHEGQRALTFVSFRLGSNFPLEANTWQTVMQMKQAQPSANGGGTPMLSLRAMNGQWSLWQSDSVNFSELNHQVWSTPAAKETWTRFALDITYSQDPSVGKVTVHVDLNGDGDAADSGEQSPTLSMATLKRETTGGTDDGIAPGESIPSHLRAGIYHNPAIACPAPLGCSNQVDNVQVVRP